MPALFFFACTNQPAAPSYLISGTVTGGEVEQVYLQLFNIADKTFYNVDTAAVSQGTFQFSGSLHIPDLYRLILPSGHNIELFLENSTISVHIDMEKRSNSTVTGSASDSVYKVAVMSDNIASAIEKYPTSYALPYCLYRFHTYNKTPEELTALAGLFDPEVVYNSPYMDLLFQLIETYCNVAVGKSSLEIALPDPEGKERRLSECLGNYVLLDFWASWCPPCREENPNMVKLYKMYHSKGFEIYGVSLDRTKEDWVQGIEEDQLPWIHVSDIKFWGCEPAYAYGVRSIPSNFLIDPQGVIVARNILGEALAQKLAEIYGK